MFIREVYQRRIAQQAQLQQTIKNKFKTKPPALGSARLNKINYDNNEDFFTRDDIPAKVLKLKQETLDFKDPDILKLKKKSWNTSVEIPKRFQDEESLERKLLKIRKGMLDYKPIQIKQKTNYAGTDTRNDYTNWNVSNYIEKNDHKEGLFKTTIQALRNSEYYSKRKLKNYLSLIDRFQHSQSYRKQQFQSNHGLSQTLKSEFTKFNPYSSAERTNAVVFKQLQLSKLNKLKSTFQDRSTQESFHSFRANLSPKQKLNVSIVFQHTGIWQKTTNSHEDEWAWSCCMNQQKDSKGCVKKTQDKNKLNFASYTHD